MCNSDIRSEIANAGLRHWQIADALNINQSTLCIWMRHELTSEKKAQIRSIIKDLSKK